MAYARFREALPRMSGPRIVLLLMPALALALVANLLFAATFAAQPAHACSCSPPPSPEEELRRAEQRLQKADAVFSGVVVDVETRSGSPQGSMDLLFDLVTLDVEESWKGVSAEPVVVFDKSLVLREAGGSGGSDCTCDGSLQEAGERFQEGGRFQEGDRLLVYASAKGSEQVPGESARGGAASGAEPKLPGGRDPADYPVRTARVEFREEFGEDVPPGTMDPSRGTKSLDEAEADLQALGAAERAFPRSVGRERVDTTTPTSGFGSGPAPVVVASVAVLFVLTLGGLTLWRWRRLG